MKQSHKKRRILGLCLLAVLFFAVLGCVVKALVSAEKEPGKGGPDYDIETPVRFDRTDGVTVV